MFSSRNAQDRTWSSLFGVLMLSMVLGLSACSSGSSDSFDDSNSGGGGDTDGTDGTDGGGAAENGCTGDPTNTCDFDVRLVFSGSNNVKSTSYSYSRPEFAPDWNWTSADGKSFGYLQTALFKVDAGAPAGLWVSDLAGSANCMMVLNGKEVAYLTLGGDISSNQYSIPSTFSEQTPIQLTLIPFSSDTACSNGAGVREAERALAVFIAKPTSSLTPDCDIQNNVSEMDGYTSGSCEITGSKQSWVHSTDASGTQYVEFRGSLVNMLNSQRANNQLSIRIGETASLDRGLSTQTARFEVTGNNCAAIVSKINTDGFDAVKDKTTGCNVAGGVERIEAQNAADQLIVEGFGRINGYTVLDRYKRCKPKDKDTSACGTSFSGGAFTPWEEARWTIDGQLLNLSSEYQSHSATFGIDVSHITVAWPTYRGQSPIELNIARDGVQNNHAVKMFNVKQVGGWIDQADGPEVMGSGSQIFYTYIHAADDAIKISAPGVLYNNTTILKGAAGGAVNIGSYGYNRTVSGSKVNDVYIHRITQKKTSDTTLGFSFNDTLGVIFAPTCPIAPQGAPGTRANTSGTNINGVYIPNLGTDEGPNSIGRLFSLGVQDTEFCKKNPEVDITFGNFVFSDFEIYTNPQDVSYIFGQTKMASITWEPIKFGSRAACDTSSVRIFPDSQTKDWYCVCGPGPGPNVDAAKCLTSGDNGQGTTSGKGVNNVDYNNTGTLNTIFPYAN
jgi:hypothetical protein